MNRFLGVALVAFGLSASAPQLLAVNITFTTAGISCFNAAVGGACGAGVNNIWNTNDFLQQTFAGTGLASVNQLSLDLSLFNNLAAGVTETWDIRVNSVSVGNLSFTGPGTDPTAYSHVFNFASIAGAGSGTDYTIRFQVTSPDAASGTLGLPTGRTQSGTLSGDASGVPEPSTLALASLGILGVGFARLRAAKRS